MVFAPAFRSCLHMSIQREQNKVMLFKGLSLQTVHTNAVPVGRIFHLFQAETQPGVCTQQQSRDSLVAAARGLGYAESLHSPCSNWVARRGSHPLCSPVLQGAGMLCQWVHSMCWGHWLALEGVISVSDISASPLTSYNFFAQGWGSWSLCPVSHGPLADMLQASSP